MTPRFRRIPGQGRLVLLAAIWGMSFLFIKVSNEALAPLQVALVRIVLGAVTLLLIVLVRRDALPKEPKVWGHLLVAGLLFNVLPFTLFAYGETLTTSVLAGIWNATTPLLTLPLAVLMLPDEPATTNRVVGLVLGFAGVLVVLGVWTGLGGNALLGNLACLAASACYGLGFPYMRKYLAGRPESLLGLAAGQLICASLTLAVVTPFFTTMPKAMPLKVLAAILALGVVGTGLAYILNYSLIKDVGATAASTVTFLIPLFSTLAGVLILREPLVWNEPVGAIVVILGIAVSRSGTSHFPRARLKPDRRS